MTLKFQADVLKKKEIEVPRLPTVDLGSQALDPKNWTQKVVSSAKAKSAQSGPGLQQATPDADVRLFKDALLGPAEKLIREAKELIREKKFKEARVVLAKAQKADPDVLMAPILDGLCCNRLNDDWTALECVRNVHGRTMDQTTRKCYEQLMDLIRKRMLPALVDDCVAQLDAKKYQSAVKILKRAVSLDPTVTVYHSLHAQALFLMEQLDDALAAADAGLAACPADETEDLDTLRDQIVKQLTVTAMQPAIACYRKHEFAQARVILAGLAPVIQELPVWNTFDRYLSSLTGWFFNKKVASIAPAGSPEEVEALYNLLVGQEINLARLMLLMLQFEHAAQTLEQAHEFAPRCAYLQFLRGVCIYQHTGHELAVGTPPELETVCYRLQEAHAHAARALELGYVPARDFMGVLESILKPMQEFVAPPDEAKLINAAVEQFVQAMKLGGDGITSLKHLDQVYRAIQAAGKQVEKLKGRVRSKSAIGTLDDLTQAVKSHCQQLDNLRQDFQDGEIAEKHFIAFKKQIDANQKRPISSLAELNTAREFFKDLKSRIEADRRSIRSAQIKQDLDQLSQAVSQILKQL